VERGVPFPHYVSDPAESGQLNSPQPASQLVDQAALAICAIAAQVKFLETSEQAPAQKAKDFCYILICTVVEGNDATFAQETHGEIRVHEQMRAIHVNHFKPLAALKQFGKFQGGKSRPVVQVSGQAGALHCHKTAAIPDSLLKRIKRDVLPIRWFSGFPV
jgi:hypothetical protein